MEKVFISIEYLAAWSKSAGIKTKQKTAKIDDKSRYITFMRLKRRNDWRRMADFRWFEQLQSESCQKFEKKDKTSRIRLKQFMKKQKGEWILATKIKQDRSRWDDRIFFPSR